MNAASPGTLTGRPTPPSKLWSTVWLLVSAAVVVWAVWTVDANWARMLGSLPSPNPAVPLPLPTMHSTEYDIRFDCDVTLTTRRVCST